MAPALKATPQPVLVPVDNSEAALRLVEYVTRTFSKEQAVELLHVQPKYYGALPGSSMAPEFIAEDLETINAELETESTHFMHDRLAPLLKEAGFQEAKTVLMRNSSDGSSAIGAAICKRADDVGAPLLVVTKTSKSFISRMFTGSVTRYLLDHSPVPLLIC